MFETGRRSATSTSELGLYSDRSDHYHRNRYGVGVRKYVIGVMVVLAIILVSVLLYDFTSSATVINDGIKETKHSYILQNALKRPSINSSKRTTTTANPRIVDGNKTELVKMEDRSDGDYDQEKDTDNSGDLEDQITSETRSITIAKPDLEFRSENLNNFNLRKRLSSIGDENEEKVQSKQLVDNHAMIYRLRRRYKHPVSEEDTSLEESRPIPFHFEYKTPIPTSFKRSRYPQLSQYRYPQSSNNIQDIIKYLTKDNERPNRGIKFSGVYVNPKKFDFYPEAGETMSNSDRSEEQNPSPISFSFNSDPFHQYKPKNPSDVNLLATSNVRFSPSGVHRYNPSHYDPYSSRPPMHFNTQLSSPSSSESQYENYGSYTTATFGKKRMPKPFSVMLDIYPIPDSADPNRKSSRPRSGMSGQENQALPEEYEARRPIPHNKGSKHSHSLPPSQPISLVAVPGQQSSLDDEERQQMIFHLNLYPKRRNKFNRNDIIPRSHRIEEEVDENVPAPFDTIAKHLTDHSAIQVSKFEDTRLSDEAKDSFKPKNPTLTRYEESELGERNHEQTVSSNDDKDYDRNREQEKMKNANFTPPNHRPDFTIENITGRYLESFNERFDTVLEGACENCKNESLADEASKSEETKKSIEFKDIDTVEGFEDFADGLLATD